MPIHQHGIGERPQVFGRLQLRRMRRQKEQVNMLGHPHPRALGALSASCPVHRTDRVGSIRWETDGIATTLVEAAGEDIRFW